MKIDRQELEEMGWKAVHFSNISRWVLKRWHFNGDLKQKGEALWKAWNHVEDMASPEAGVMWSLKCFFFFPADLLLNHQVLVFYWKLSLWVLYKCDLGGEGSHWTVLMAQCSLYSYRKLLTVQSLKTWPALFKCSELNAPTFENE